MDNYKDQKTSVVLKLFEQPQIIEEWFEIKSSPELEETVFYLDRKRKCRVKYDHATRRRNVA